MSTEMKFNIQHNQSQQRFDTRIENLLCTIEYELAGENLSLNHVGVPKPLEGRGIAGQLTQAALDWARAENYRVNPVCPYVQTWLHRHPEYQDLVGSQQ